MYMYAEPWPCVLVKSGRGWNNDTTGLGIQDKKSLKNIAQALAGLLRNLRTIGIIKSSPATRGLTRL